MKTTSITKYITSLLTVSGILLTAPLTVTAQNLVVTTNTTVSGTHYENKATGTAALTNSGTWTFTGSDVILTGTGASGLPARGANFTGGGVLNLTDSAVNSNLMGVYLSGSSTANLVNTNVTTQNQGGNAIQVLTSSTLIISGGTLHTFGVTGNGVQLSGTSTARMENVVVITENETNNSSGAIHLTASSTLMLTGGTVQTLGGNRARGVSVNTDSRAHMENLTIITSGTEAIGLSASAGSSVTINDTKIATTGMNATGIHVSSATVSGTRLAVVTNGDAANGLHTTGGIIDLTDSQISTSGSDSHGAAVLNGGHITLTNVNVSAARHTVLRMTTNAPDNSLTISGGTLAGTQLLHARATDTGVNELTLTNVDAAQAGDVVIDSADLGRLNLNVSGGSGIVGDINNHGSGTVTVSMTNSSLTGDYLTSGTSANTLNFNRSDWLGKTTVSDNAVLNIVLDNNAHWNMTGKSKITTLGSSGGSITIDNVEGEDLTVSGGISGQTALNLTLSDSVKGGQEIWVVVDETNAMSNSAFSLGREVSAGMYQYELVNASDGAWLVYTGTTSGTTPPVNPPDDPEDPPVIPPVPSGPPIISNEGDAIINTAAAVAGFWFTQLDNLHKRMGELRYNKPANGDVLDNVWVRAYGQQINASTGIYSVNGFSEIQYGVDLGTDCLWKLDAANQLYTGLFTGYGGADRQFHTNYSGNTDSGYGGLYATWLNNSGWYADVVAKGQYFRNEFSGADRGDYDSVGVGFSVELGRQFEFKDGWFAEPSVQFSYLHLMNDNYTTRDGMSVDLTDADVLHIYGGARFGRNIKLNNSARLQPYIKAGGLGQISSGNTLTVSGDHWRPNLDGARAVVGAGVVWQLDTDSQLHLDYEAIFGEKYDKPWGVNFGYRYQF